MPNLADADLDNGRYLFWLGDCSSCHATTGQDDPEHLGGGRILDTKLGRFHVPNISPHREYGIGAWTLAEFDRALRQGVRPSKIWPDGEHLYPAFPYLPHQQMSPADMRDLYAYMKTLPESDQSVPAHELHFPYNIRRGIVLWRAAVRDRAAMNSFGAAAANLPTELDRTSHNR